MRVQNDTDVTDQSYVFCCIERQHLLDLKMSLLYSIVQVGSMVSQPIASGHEMMEPLCLSAPISTMYENWIASLLIT